MPSQAQKPKTDPVCPACGEDPARLSCMGPLKMGTVTSMVVFCGNPGCRKILTVNVVGIEQPKVIPAFDPRSFRSIS